MLRLPSGIVGSCPFLFLLLLVTCLVHPALAQLETATVSGQVVDPSGLGVTGAHVKLVDIDRDSSTSAATNNSGLYTFASVHPGRYRMEVDAAGFKIVNVTGLTLNVQDHIEQNFRLQVGSVAESVTVEASAQQVNTTDATVSTVVDRQFAENLPMNGRSFQTLIELTPGVVVTPSSAGNEGQFSVNGQRSTSNYWMVDGVSANIGIGATGNGVAGSGVAGALGSFSAQGGTNSLVSVDALQEFRIQTSTYAPEFGRTPGGQISIVTRSGTNQFHGTAFDYLRNDILDANDWFADSLGLPKPMERQNDFGGTFSGPILKNKTFFFFSYEGLRLRLPEVEETQVPSLSARQSAIPATQPILNAFPLPKAGAPDINGLSPLNASFSNSSTLNATSIRIDHRVNDKLSLFGRYNYSPSELIARAPLSQLTTTRIATQTATVGATSNITPAIANDLRFNYSRNDANGYYSEDTFGGAVPLTVSDLQLPSSFTVQNSSVQFYLVGVGAGFLFDGKEAHNLQRQFNLVDNLSLQRGSHSLKFGADYRRLNPLSDPPAYGQFLVFFGGVSSVETGSLGYGQITSTLREAFLFRNLGLFAQDTWRVNPRLAVTYGVRWDVDVAPTTTSGPNFAAVTNFDNLAQLALAPAGTPVFKTTYGNLAPRLGVAYQLSQKPGSETVIRGGWGIFYDLATQQLGSILAPASYPFGAAVNVFSQYPLTPAASAPPPISIAQLASNGGTLPAFDPNLKLPYTMQWNVALEQSLGAQQSVTASYVGAVGRRLLQIERDANPNFSSVEFINNQGSSDYDALQLQFQRRLAHGLQALASYSWAHSIDTASQGSSFDSASGYIRGTAANANRASSDFDIRHAASVGVTYDLPAPTIDTLADAILRGWSLQSVLQARSSPPVDVLDPFVFLPGYGVYARPDVLPGQPFYLYGSQYPGGKAFNPAAFANPPYDPNTFIALRQGDLPRNALRGFGAWQWDFGVHRDFRIRESISLQFRAEMFNILNHPNFGSPFNEIGYSSFGQSTQMLGQSLGGSYLGGGGFDPQYQIGGPRSIQLALQFRF